MIKKLHVLTLKSFIAPFIATFIVAIFVLILQFLWLYVDELVGKGLEAWVIIKLLFYASVQVVPLAMPISVMLSSMMAFGNMGENHELIAIKSSGISIIKVYRPLIILSALLGLLNFYFADTVVPAANLKLQTLLFDIRQRHPALNFQPGIFNYDVEGYVIRISKKNPHNDMMYNFLIYDHKNAFANNRLITADSGTLRVTDDMKYLVADLYNGYQYEEIHEDQPDPALRKYPHREDKFSHYRVIIKLQGFQMRQTDERLFRSNYQMLSARRLRQKIDSLKIAYERRKKFYEDIILNNYMFVKGLKLYSRRDTFNYYAAMKIWYQIPPKKLPIVTNTDSLYQHMDITSKQEAITRALNFANRIISQLKMAKIDLKSKQVWIAKHEIAYYRKYTFSVACFLFFFIGAPIGSIIRKGGFGFPAIASVSIFLLYYIISISGENLILQGGLKPEIGMWLSTFIFIPIGAYLVYKVATDKVITNFDYIMTKIQTFLKRAFSYSKRKFKKINK